MLKEIELIQKNQDSIKNGLRNIRQEKNNYRNNGSPNTKDLNNLNNNFISKKRYNNISTKNTSNNNDNNLRSNSLIKKNLESIGKNMRYDLSDLSNQIIIII